MVAGKKLCVGIYGIGLAIWTDDGSSIVPFLQTLLKVTIFVQVNGRGLFGIWAFLVAILVDAIRYSIGGVAG